jgi:hypothetical protein
MPTSSTILGRTIPRSNGWDPTRSEAFTNKSLCFKQINPQFRFREAWLLCKWALIFCRNQPAVHWAWALAFFKMNPWILNKSTHRPFCVRKFYIWTLLGLKPLQFSPNSFKIFLSLKNLYYINITFKKIKFSFVFIILSFSTF